LAFQVSASTREGASNCDCKQLHSVTDAPELEVTNCDFKWEWVFKVTNCDLEDGACANPVTNCDRIAPEF